MPDVDVTSYYQKLYLIHRMVPFLGICCIVFTSFCMGDSQAAQPSDFEAVCRAVEDLQATYGNEYAVSIEKIAVLRQACAEYASTTQAAEQRDAAAVARIREYDALAREALLANPLLDFDEILLVKRFGQPPGPAPELGKQFLPAPVGL
jgi:hypothetical protein